MKSGIRQAIPEEMAIINERFAKKELKIEDVYVFDVFACDDNILTAYFSRLGTDMIEAFQRDVHKRDTDPNSPIVGYLFGHNDQMIPSGTLFKSELVKEINAEGKTINKFKPTVFMPKNLNVGGINTDDYIKAYESGTTEDCSVGFIAASYICDLCGFDIRDFWHCEHTPGRFFNMAPEGEPIVMKQCTYTVHPGLFNQHNLMELSGVYRGAMWGARIEPSNLSIVKKDEFVKKDEKDRILVSTNIKDFKPNDILRFNCAFDGSIELVGSLENGKDSEKYQVMENELKRITKERDELNLKIEGLSGTLLDLSEENKNLKTENAKLKDDIKELTRVFALSESDKVGLQEKLDEANREIERLGIELKHRVEEVDQYIADLRGRCKKLSIQINGQSFNEGFFDKEVLSLSVDELRQKISILEEQLAQMIKVGRLTVVTDKVHQGNLANNAPNAPQNSKLFKIK
jgi:regulator of replication initiation timing